MADIRRIFVSYAHSDEDLAPEFYAQVFTYLKTVQHNDDLAVWTDKEISTGDDWYAEITGALKACSAGVLLIGPGFLNSDFIKRQELPALFESADASGIPIFPVKVISVPGIAPWMQRLQTFGHVAPLEEDEGPVLRKRLAALAEQIHKTLADPPKPSPRSKRKIDLRKLPGWDDEA